MSTYYTWTKTNWFRVSDENKFKDILNNLSIFSETDDKIIHNSYKDNDGYYHHRLMCYGELLGKYDQDNEEYEDIETALYKPLQELLPSNSDVFVLKYVGVEKLRSVDSGYTIVTKHDIVYNNIDRVIDKNVSELIGDDILIDFEYKDSNTEYIKGGGY